MSIQEAIREVVEGRDLSLDAAANAMRVIMTGEATPAQFGAFVTALRMKGETAEEIAGMAKVMREVSLHVQTDLPVIDTCGTGGDAMGWFNISTAAAFVVAGAGVPVAKHGNRAMSGSTGSADVLEAFGVNVNLGPEGVLACVMEAGIGFMFAQAFHPAMKYAAGPRREIGIRTVFNMLGPLTNPAGARRQVIGVANGDDAEKIANAMKLLGTDYTLVVHAESGADEVDVEGHTLLYQVTPDMMKRRRTRPADYGLPEGDRTHLKVSSTKESVERINAVFAGNGGEHNAPPSQARSCYSAVVINAATALMAAGKATSFQDGADMAKESIESGAAKAALAKLVKVSQAAA